MVIDMNEARLETIAQIRNFLAGTADTEFAAPTDEAARHAWVAKILRRFAYSRCGRESAAAYGPTCAGSLATRASI
jgi:hypothetical protein